MSAVIVMLPAEWLCGKITGKKNQKKYGRILKSLCLLYLLQTNKISMNFTWTAIKRILYGIIQQYERIVLRSVTEIKRHECVAESTREHYQCEALQHCIRFQKPLTHTVEEVLFSCLCPAESGNEDLWRLKSTLHEMVCQITPSPTSQALD